jgi:hypothetical protein
MIGDYMPISRGGWWINRLDLNYAARRLEISGEYLDKRFTLIFRGFQVENWQVYGADYDPGVESLDVIGFDVSKRGQRDSVVLSTDLFAIILTYGKLEILKDW